MLRRRRSHPHLRRDLPEDEERVRPAPRHSGPPVLRAHNGRPHRRHQGRRRPVPTGLLRCFPDGVGKFDNVTGNVICHGDPSLIKEGHKSFPPCHSSWSFAGLGFLSWYLARSRRSTGAATSPSSASSYCRCSWPLLLASSYSRVDDYWHHWQDVFVGGILGLVVASFCYLQFFPPPSGDKVTM